MVRMGRMGIFAGQVVAALVFLNALPGSPAGAQTPQQINQCVNRGKVNSPDVQLQACAAVIQSGKWTGKNLAWAYNDRGDAYTDKKDYDQAIAAYNEGIKLDRDDTFGYSGRCIAHAWKSEFDAAIKDCTQAIRLKPDFGVALCWRGLAEQASGQAAAGEVDIGEALKVDSSISCPSGWRP